MWAHPSLAEVCSWLVVKLKCVQLPPLLGPSVHSQSAEEKSLAHDQLLRMNVEARVLSVNYAREDRC